MRAHSAPESDIMITELHDSFNNRVAQARLREPAAMSHCPHKAGPRLYLRRGFTLRAAAAAVCIRPGRSELPDHRRRGWRGLSSRGEGGSAPRQELAPAVAGGWKKNELDKQAAGGKESRSRAMAKAGSLCVMAKQVVGQGQGHHGLHHRHLQERFDL